MARTYHVLKENEGPIRLYNYLAKIEASNPEQAIRLTAVDHGTGRYVAVPDGNWTSIGVRVEIPAPRVIFENEPQASDATGPSETALVKDDVYEEDVDVELAMKIGDEAFQERKAELAARLAEQ